jgi:ABC-type amino acid transport system permease subunit
LTGGLAVFHQAIWSVHAMNGFQSFIDNFIMRFQLNFINENRYMLFVDGLKTTLIITIAAVAIGVALGVITAVIKVMYANLVKPKLEAGLNPYRGPGRSLGSALLDVGEHLCNLYLTVIRGTPVMVQLLIIYFVVFAAVNIPKVVVAIFAFGINSGAYVAEIVRAGIMAVDRGQTEAGRSLGLGYIQTMRHIVLPQAFKNILPALGNEFIALLKETSIVGYIALQDLTRAGDVVQSRTYDAFMPLIAVALIYLAIVLMLTKLLGRMERRLRRSDTH